MTSIIDILRFSLLIVAMAAPLAPLTQAADCNEDILQEAVDQANQDLRKPSVAQATTRAQKDWDDDKKIENDADFKYLAAAAYINTVEQLRAGSIDVACSQCQGARVLFELLRNAE
jgi:hypothetical protein